MTIHGHIAFPENSGLRDSGRGLRLTLGGTLSAAGVLPLEWRGDPTDEPSWNLRCGRYAHVGGTATFSESQVHYQQRWSTEPFGEGELECGLVEVSGTLSREE